MIVLDSEPRVQVKEVNIFVVVRPRKSGGGVVCTQVEEDWLRGETPEVYAFGEVSPRGCFRVLGFKGLGSPWAADEFFGSAMQSITEEPQGLEATSLRHPCGSAYRGKGWN